MGPGCFTAVQYINTKHFPTDPPHQKIVKIPSKLPWNGKEDTLTEFIF